METDSRALALAFAGTLIGGCALGIALLCAQDAAAVGLLVMTVFCAIEFIGHLDFDVVNQS